MYVQQFFEECTIKTRIGEYVLGESLEGATRNRVASVSTTWASNIRKWSPRTRRKLAKAFPFIDFSTEEELKEKMTRDTRRKIIFHEWQRLGSEMIEPGSRLPAIFRDRIKELLEQMEKA